MAFRAQTVMTGFSQATPAMLATLRGSGAVNSSAPRTRRSPKRAKAMSTSRGRARKSSSGSRGRRSKAAKFVKGSAAAKRHMAKLRKMVGKRR